MLNLLDALTKDEQAQARALIDARYPSWAGMETHSVIPGVNGVIHGVNGGVNGVLRPPNTPLNTGLNTSDTPDNTCFPALGGQRGGDVVPVSKARKDPEKERQAIEILAFLNVKAERSFRPVEENLRFIRARLNTSTVEDLKGVIARKTREWKNTERAKYLRPATLFNATMFEQYIGEQEQKHV